MFYCLRLLTLALLSLAISHRALSEPSYTQPALLNPVTTLPHADVAAIDGNRAIIADSTSNSIIFYSISNEQFLEVARFDSDPFGHDIQVAIHGDHALVGGWLHHDQYQPLRFFHHENGQWRLAQLARDPRKQDKSEGFGAQIVLANDKAVVASGNYNPTLYLYEHDGTQWVITATLDPATQGISIHTFDLDGETLVTSTSFEYADIQPAAVHVFSLSNGSINHQQTIGRREDPRIEYSGSDYSSPRFVTLDGDTLLIGSPTDSLFNGLSAGAAHVYRRNNNNLWQYSQTLTEAQGLPGSQFGNGVRLYDGRAIIGRDSIFMELDGLFVESAYIEPGTNESQFGPVLSISNQYMIVPHSTDSGQPSRLYTLADLQIPPQQTPHPNAIHETQIVKAVQIDPVYSADTNRLAGDEDQLVIKDGPGIRSFQFESEIWSEVSTIEPVSDLSEFTQGTIPPDWEIGADPNSTFAIDKNELIISVEMDEFSGPPHDQLHYYRLIDGNWNRTAVIHEPTYEFGQEFGLAVDIHESTIAASGPNVHSGYEEVVYLYEYKDGEITETQQIIGEAYDKLGQSLQLEKEHLMISAVGNDRVYFYKKGDKQWLKSSTIQNTDYTPAIALHRNTAAIQVSPNLYGQKNINKQQSVDIFEYKNDLWMQVGGIHATDYEIGDQFGHAIAITGSTILVGAPGDNDLGNNSGSVYAYQLIDESWTEVAKLNASDGKAGDRFGTSIVTTRDHIVISNYSLAGAQVYSFDLQLIAGDRSTAPNNDASDEGNPMTEDTATESRATSASGGGQIDIVSTINLLLFFAFHSARQRRTQNGRIV